MPAFVWKGKNRDGKAVSGEQAADTKEAVMAVLRRQQILVSSVKEKGKEVALPKFSGSVPPKDLAVFTRQFSVMIDAGLPLVQCLEILGNQQENKTFAKILQHTRMDV
jgi:type IV pilus assembly protein PilC